MAMVYATCLYSTDTILAQRLYLKTTSLSETPPFICFDGQEMFLFVFLFYVKMNFCLVCVLASRLFVYNTFNCFVLYSFCTTAAAAAFLYSTHACDYLG